MIRLLYALALLFTVGAQASQLQTTCGKIDTAPAFEYCVYKTVGSTNTDVMYYLHGAGQNVHAWEIGGPGEDIRAQWEKAGKGAPTVVSLSYGPLWFLAKKNTSAVSGLYEDFIGRVLPTVEGSVLQRQVNKRLLFGISMGGFNSTQLYLNNPELFSRVVLGCPALVNISPYSSAEELKGYQERNHVSDGTMKYLEQVGAYYWPTAEAYNGDTPLATADQRLNASYPPLHISSSDADAYGFEEGAKIFADKATAHDVTVTWQFLKGGHCTLDTGSIAQFLLP